MSPALATIGWDPARTVTGDPRLKVVRCLQCDGRGKVHRGAMFSAHLIPVVCGPCSGTGRVAIPKGAA